jgi:hypothetical protein
MDYDLLDRCPLSGVNSNCAKIGQRAYDRNWLIALKNSSVAYFRPTAARIQETVINKNNDLAGGIDSGAAETGTESLLEPAFSTVSAKTGYPEGMC